MEFGMFSHPVTFLGTGITVLLVLMPLIYRLSRSIWIAMFTHKGGMKKGALTFEEPLQPNRLIHALVESAVNQNRDSLRGHVVQGCT